MRVSKKASKIALQLIIIGTLVLSLIGVLSGCTLIVNSENVNTEIVPAVSAVELVL